MMKRDINLIPRKNAGKKQSKALAIVIMIAIFYGISLALAFMIPSGIKEGLLLIEKQLDLQIEQLQPQVDEYDKLRVELQRLQAELESAGSIYFNKFDATDALDILESTCPENVKIGSIDNDGVSMTITVVAEDNYQIAQFALELERTGFFEQVHISGSIPTTVVQDETMRTESESGVSSTIYLIYDLSEPEPETEEAEATDTPQEGDN